MAKPNYVVIKGCSVEGERLNVGDELPAKFQSGKEGAQKVTRLRNMKRVVDVNTEDGKAALDAVYAAEAKAKGKSKAPAAPKA